MKKTSIILSLLLVFCLVLSACSAPAIQTDSNDSIPSDTSGSSVAQEPVHTPETSSNVLIVYYSYSGVTEGIAQTLQEKTGGDLYEIEVVEPYPDGRA